MGEERFARWVYPLLLTVALSVAGRLTIDETGFLFPPVAVAVLGATAGFAVLRLPRSERFILAASEGFLWTIAIASLRAQGIEAAWLTVVAIVVALVWGTVMAFRNVVVAAGRSSREEPPFLVLIASIYVVGPALVAVGDRTLVRRCPLALPTSWLCLAAGGLLVAGACAVTWFIRHPLARRPHPSVPDQGPYRRVPDAPDAPRELPSALWRYGRLLALAALLPPRQPGRAQLRRAGLVARPPEHREPVQRGHPREVVAAML